jgi:hypothetical protein
MMSVQDCLATSLSNVIELALQRHAASMSRRRLEKILIRASSSRNAIWKARSLSSSVPSAAAGSAIPQCAVMG